MCLTGKKNWWQRVFRTDIKPKIAKKDITVYKYLKDQQNGLLRSPFVGAIYQIGVQQFADLDIRSYKYTKTNTFSVEAGLHAFTDYETAIEQCRFGSDVFKAIIPKGSEYLLGMGNEIVSSHLIIVEKMK